MRIGKRCHWRMRRLDRSAAMRGTNGEYLLWAAAEGQLPGVRVALHFLNGLSAALIDIQGSHCAPAAVHFHPAASHVASGSRWNPYVMLHASRRRSLEVDIDALVFSHGLDCHAGFVRLVYQYTYLV